MIELKNFETKLAAGGMYYTVLGTTVGAFSLAGWAISLAGRDTLARNNFEAVFQISVVFGGIGAAFGSVVGLCIDSMSVTNGA
jgi:hypothetical protein